MCYLSVVNTIQSKRNLLFCGGTYLPTANLFNVGGTPLYKRSKPFLIYMISI